MKKKKIKKFYLIFIKKKNLYIKLIFFFIIILIFFTNSYYGYYQKGLLPKENINIYLGYIIKWFLLFGLTSISCLLIEYDLKINKKISLFVIALFFLELFLTNLSLLSRALIFTGGAVLFSIYYNYEKNLLKKNYQNSFIVYFLILFVVFIISIFPVNKLRHLNVVDQNFIANKILNNYKNSVNTYAEDELIKNNILNGDIEKNNLEEILKSEIDDQTKIEIIERDLKKTNNHIFDYKKNFDTVIFLIKNRFIGLDAVAAVSSYPEKNFNLFYSSLKEKFDSKKYGFYQRVFVIPFEQPHLINKKYTNTSKRHYGIIIPGVIGYLSYSGSIFFLFFSLSIVFIFCASIEAISRKLSFNSVIFSNFVGYVLAYRLIHFGYLPGQTYLLISAILLTVLIVYLIKKIIILFHATK